MNEELDKEYGDRRPEECRNEWRDEILEND